MQQSSKAFILYVRNFIFGAEDSLVSTVGLLTGITSAGVAQKEIIVSGIILICVEAFSMSVGSFLSERTTEESSPTYEQGKSASLWAAIIMFVSYIVFGFITLVPYLFFPIQNAFWCSIGVSLLALFLLGYVSSKLLNTKKLRSGFRMMIIGGLAIGLGVTIGMFLK